MDMAFMDMAFICWRGIWGAGGDWKEGGRGAWKSGGGGDSMLEAGGANCWWGGGDII